MNYQEHCYNKNYSKNIMMNSEIVTGTENLCKKNKKMRQEKFGMGLPKGCSCLLAVQMYSP